MAQVRIDECLLNDPRFKQLVRLIEKQIPDLLTPAEKEELALGKCWRAFHVAQKYWRDDRKPVPASVWSMDSCASFASQLVAVGLANKTKDGFYVSGAKAYFDWFHTKQEAGRLGGIKSGSSRNQKKNKLSDEASEAETRSNEPVSVSVSVSDSVSVTKKKATPSMADKDPPGLFAPAELLAIWNTHRGRLDAASRMTAGRAAKVRVRRDEHPDLAYWVGCVQRLSASDFATGKNDRGWKATFDWLIANDANHVKVSEGKYDNRGPKARNDSYTVVTDLRQLDDL
jgi:hypothetical protein